MNIPDHPAIDRALRYGTPEGGRIVCETCDECGAEIYEDEIYYEIDGRIYCPECLYEEFGHRANDTF